MRTFPRRHNFLSLLGLLLLGAARVRGAEPAALHLLCWTEYVPAGVLESFTRETGARVETDFYSSNEQMLARLRERPGWADVVQPSGFYVATLAAQGALEPLDLQHLPHARFIDEAYRRLPFDPEQKYSVPWLAGTVGIVVDTARVKEPIHTWAEVFSGKHRGRIVVVDDAREMLAWALAALGKPIEQVGPAAIMQAEPVLRAWLPQVAVFDSDRPHTALLDGRADLGIVWSGEAALLWQLDHRFQYVLPAEGAHRFVDSLAVSKGAPHRELAERFLDYCLRPEISAQIATAFPYTSPSAATRARLTQEQQSNPASYPPGADRLPMLRNEGASAVEIAAWMKKLRGTLVPAAFHP